MKFLSRALFLLFILVGVLIAVSNSQPVELALWPLPHVLALPLYLLVVALLLVGVLAGWRWAGGLAAIIAAAPVSGAARRRGSTARTSACAKA